MTISLPHQRRVYHRIFLSFLVLVAGMCGAGSAMAGDNFLTGSPLTTVNNLPRVYLTLASGVAPDLGVAGMAELTVGGEHLQVSGRVGGATGISIFGPPPTSVGELGVLVGYGQSLGLAHFYAATGLGMVSVDRRGREIPASKSGDDWGWHTVEYERVKENTFNIPIQVGVDFGRRIAAGGVALVANLNSSASYVGLLLTVSLGKIR